jgi:hypothetical protein
VLDHMIKQCMSFVSYNHWYLIYCVTTVSCSFLSVQQEEQILSDTFVSLVAETGFFE